MRLGDIEAVSRIYEARADAAPPPTFSARLRRLFEEPERSVALVAEHAGEVIGYVVAELRSWEFGSEPAGWVFGVSVAQEHEGEGVARTLLEAATRGLRSMGASTVRTMVRGDDVAVLRLFRGRGFVAGPYTQLELSLDESLEQEEEQ